MKQFITSFSIICLMLFNVVQAQPTDKSYRLQKNISYIHPGETDTYKQERCKLDIYYPVDKKDFATIVWFHGGGLEGGAKHFSN